MVTVIGDVEFFCTSRRDWNPVSFISLSSTIEFDIEPKSLARVVVVQWILQERRVSQSRVWFFSRTPHSLVTSVNTHVLVNYSKSRAFSLTKRICKTRRNKMKIFQKITQVDGVSVDGLGAVVATVNRWIAATRLAVAWIQALDIEYAAVSSWMMITFLFESREHYLTDPVFFHQRHIQTHIWHSIQNP